MRKRRGEGRGGEGGELKYGIIEPSMHTRGAKSILMIPNEARATIKDALDFPGELKLLKEGGRVSITL